ncbi:hypothetical protein GCM10009809_12330 [Isoptericola hypogeus]|uniref:Beta-N-acetylhexosaminidase n=1 Tax=Isoptericola hypogeus TaxID=300179 RepID=A0ABP4V4V9_9MICO
MSSTTSAATPMWSSLPQPTSVDLTGGLWQPGRRVLVTAPQAGLRREAERLADELTALGHGAAAEVPAPGGVEDRDPADTQATVVALRTGDTGMASPESFTISVGDTVEVVGGSAVGVFRATRQLLHNLIAQDGVPRGQVRSEPAVAERGLHLDAARKHYPASWIADLLRSLSWVGITTFQWHFSESLGFRIASERHPEIVSAEHHTKAEVRELLELAADLHIEVVPSLDMPGHLRQALATHPEWQLPAPAADTTHALDITSPDAVRFARDLIDEYAELFSTSRHWNLGADEFVAFEAMDDYPVLADAARSRFGPAANGFDLLTAFANDTAAHLAEHGFTARVWNDGMFRGAVVALDPGVQVTWWTNWNALMRPVTDGLAGGHRIVNFMDSLLYYVLGEVNNYPYPTSERLWAEDWHPGAFTRLPGGVAQTWGTPYPEQLLGASFSVWSDIVDAQTPDEVAAGIRRPLRGMAERAWNAGSRLGHDAFLRIEAAIG